MIFNVAALILVAVLTYLWSRWGFFSAFIHVVCTLIAGAVAFGVWEPLAQILLSFSPNSGFLSFIEGVAWSAALMLPFAVTLVLLRVIADLTIVGNVSNPGLANMIGGGACGLVSSMIAVGILTIGLGHLRRGPTLGYQPVNYTEDIATGGGSIERVGPLWIRADVLTASLYGYLSETSLYANESLAEWYPDVAYVGHTLKLSYGDKQAAGNARNAMRPEDFSVESAYRVGGQGAPATALLEIEPGVTQRYFEPDGELVSQGSLYGYQISFEAGAKDDGGQVIMGAGQIRLLIENTSTGETSTIHPVAVIGETNAADGTLGRFAFDAKNTFIASVGGASQVNMVFEFLVPTGSTPKAIYVKNARAIVEDMTPTEFASIQQRNAGVRAGSLLGGSKIENIDRSDAQVVRASSQSSNVGGLDITNKLGFKYNKQNTGNLEITDNRRIIRGENRFSRQQKNPQNANRDLIVDTFGVSNGTLMVQLDVSDGQPASLLNRVVRNADRSLPPQLVDANGTAYLAAGYIYEDQVFTEVRFDPGAPIQARSELPEISSSRSDQKLTLLFLVTENVNLDVFAIGNQAVVDFSPPIAVTGRQD